MIEHVRAAFGEMDDAFHGILAGNVLAAARRRLTAVPRAAERAGGAGLRRGDVGARRERRALRMTATARSRIGRCPVASSATVCSRCAAFDISTV